MDAIINFCTQSPVLLIALVLIVGFLFSRLGGGSAQDKSRPEDLVPSYRRFERRESEMGDRRRNSDSAPETPERRQGGRRGRDARRGKR